MTQWIKVEDRLPEPHVDVLGFATSIEDTYFAAGEKYCVIESFRIWPDGMKPSFRTDRFYKAKVTHWMPLPEVPKEDV